MILLKKVVFDHLEFAIEFLKRRGYGKLDDKYSKLIIESYKLQVAALQSCPVDVGDSRLMLVKDFDNRFDNFCRSKDFVIRSRSYYNLREGLSDFLWESYSIQCKTIHKAQPGGKHSSVKYFVFKPKVVL